MSEERLKNSSGKVVINTGTIGHVDHGKTTLSAAITKAVNQRYGLSKFISYDEIKTSPQERQKGITINQSTIHFETPTRYVNHVDCPGHADYVKNMITGASSLDFPMLTVSAVDGVQAQTRAHTNLIANLLSARPLKERILIVVINQIDRVDIDMIELITSEVADFLDSYVTKGCFDRYMIYTTSALKAVEGDQASLDAIADMIDEICKLPVPTRPIDQPFLMSVENVYKIEGRGTVYSGSISAGSVKLGDSIEILMAKNMQSVKTTVISIGEHNSNISSAVVGQNVGILPRSVDGMDKITKGDIFCAPGTRKMCKSFIADCYVYSTEEGGRVNAIKSGFQPSIFVKTQAYTGTLFFITGVSEADRATIITAAKAGDLDKVTKLSSKIAIEPGTQQEVVVMFTASNLRGVPIVKGDRCPVQEGNKNVAYLSVSDVLEIA